MERNDKATMNLLILDAQCKAEELIKTLQTAKEHDTMLGKVGALHEAVHEASNLEEYLKAARTIARHASDENR